MQAISTTFLSQCKIAQIGENRLQSSKGKLSPRQFILRKAVMYIIPAASLESIERSVSAGTTKTLKN